MKEILINVAKTVGFVGLLMPIIALFCESYNELIWSVLSLAVIAAGISVYATLEGDTAFSSVEKDRFTSDLTKKL